MGIRWTFLIICAVLCMAVGGLWLQSWRGGWTTVISGEKYTRQVTSRQGAIEVVSFSTDAEDEYYKEWKVPYWMIGIAPLAGGLIPLWGIGRGRRQPLRGFPV